MSELRAGDTPANRGLDAWSVALFALALVALFAGMGMRAPWPADEPRFAQIAREMVESGQWLFPTRGGEYYPDKPPVFMWLVAACYQLLGSLKLAFLLPSALAGLGTAALVFDLGRRLWSTRVATLAVLALVFTPQFLLQAKAAQIDALVCFWITLGCYGLIRHFVLGPSWRWYGVAFVAMALGIMTKGVGFLPVLMLIPLAIWRREVSADATGRVWSARAWWGLALLLLTLACWLVPMLLTVQAEGTAELEAYRNNILFRQTAQRYANAWGHIRPWHYFLSQGIPVVWLPLVLLLVPQWRMLGQLSRQDARARVLLGWVALVVLFFSLSSGKREVYIFPALPMLSLVVAATWDRVEMAGRGGWTAGLLRLVVLLLGAALLGLGAWLLVSPGELVAKAREYGEALQSMAWPFMVLGAVVFAAVALTWRRGLFQQLAWVSVLCWVFVALWIWPLMDPHRTPRNVMDALEQKVPASTEVGLIEFKEQLLLFTHRPLTHFSYLAPVQAQERNAWQWMKEAPASRGIVVPDGLKLSCFNMGRSQRLDNAHRRDWLWLDASAMRESCELPETSRRYHYAPQRMDILE
ncbi:glycosyltransferase family 39 protein [Hydrogenophaga sp. 5NK40-0174]|uniref:ArnT family glycosyltransferase n=1 Tax=Hydrogenophaga sp. 5NK40-0174 TaxID=3127649 RepID=UPI003102B31B